MVTVTAIRRGSTRLQAAKTSITVWGIWLGHVYHWHIVTAAMQMTMFQHLAAQHPVSPAVRPPVGLPDRVRRIPAARLEHRAADLGDDEHGNSWQMMNAFAAGRNFFDDDPRHDDRTARPARGGLHPVLTAERYPVVRHLLAAVIRRPTTMSTAVVNAFYPRRRGVAVRQALQSWIAPRARPSGGNVRGLPEMTTRAALIRRAHQPDLPRHGARLRRGSTRPSIRSDHLRRRIFRPACRTQQFRPANTPFVFKTDSRSPAGAASLADYLPYTGTIGEMITFLFTFSYSPPYIPFIPLAGIGRGASVHRARPALRSRCATPRWSSTAPISKPSSASTPPTTASRARRRKSISSH